MGYEEEADKAILEMDEESARKRSVDEKLQAAVVKEPSPVNDLGFVVLTTDDGITYAVNIDDISRIKKREEGCTLIMKDSLELHVPDSFEEVIG